MLNFSRSPPQTHVCLIIQQKMFNLPYLKIYPPLYYFLQHKPMSKQQTKTINCFFDLLCSRNNKRSVNCNEIVLVNRQNQFRQGSQQLYLKLIIELVGIYNYLTRTILYSMHKSIVPNPNSSIFTPITPQILSLIQNDTLCLQSTFFLNRINGPQINVSLTNLFLAIFKPHQTHPEYLYQAELAFDIKFETIHELDGQCPPQKAILSKIIGFRIIKDHAPKLELYAKHHSLVQLWVKHLSRHLNQCGFHRHYKPVKKIGKGGFATVYEVQRVTDKKHFAVKAFSKQATLLSSDPNHRLNLLNQIQMLRTFDSPNIITCEGVFQSQNSIYIILELLSHGQLHNRINQREAVFTPSEIKEFMKGMASGLKQMHQYRVMHRDIKPENIMLRGQTGLNPVIVDFGLSADADSEDYIFYRCGTPGYVAPEVTTLSKGQHIEPECDIFSLGAIFHIMLVRRPLFEGKKCQQVYENNKKLKFNLNSSIYKSVDSQALDLLRRMLKTDPKDRIKAAQILSHPYLSSQMETEGEKDALSPASTICSVKGINFSQAEAYF